MTPTSASQERRWILGAREVAERTTDTAARG